MVSKPMCELRNIGKTVSTRLHGIGITNEAELKKLGAKKIQTKTFSRLSEVMQKNITRTSRSFAITHWDAQKARAPYVKRYTSKATKRSTQITERK